MALKKTQRALKKWTNQDWGYISQGEMKKPRAKRGRYLPRSVRKALTSSQKAYENRKKRAASAKGRQRAKYSKSTKRKVGRAK